MNLETPRRALAIGAHPDDIEFGCGGTLAKWASEGCAIFHLVCTDGSKGSWDPAADSALLVARRQLEQRTAARELGGTDDVIFLDWPDGELESGLVQRMQVAAWIRRVRPEGHLGARSRGSVTACTPIIATPGFLATFDGIVFAARDPLFFPELDAPPHRARTLLLFEADEVDHYEDVTDFFDQKIRALLAHHSQFESTMYIDDDAESAATWMQAFIERERARLKRRGLDGRAVARRGVQANGRHLELARATCAGRVGITEAPSLRQVRLRLDPNRGGCAGFHDTKSLGRKRPRLFTRRALEEECYLRVAAAFLATVFLATAFLAGAAFLGDGLLCWLLPFLRRSCLLGDGLSWLLPFSRDCLLGYNLLGDGLSWQRPSWPELPSWRRSFSPLAFFATTFFAAVFLATAFFAGAAFFATAFFAGAARAPLELRSAFNFTPAVKPIPFDALILTAAPVCGFRPLRALRSRSLKVPNPVMRTASPERTPAVTS